MCARQVEKPDHDSGRRPCQEVLDDRHRGRLVFSTKRIALKPIAFLRVLTPLLTAHHPYCASFGNHTFHFRGRTWCIGCVFNTLSFGLAVLVLFVLWTLQPTSLNPIGLFYGGLAGVATYAIISVLRLGYSTRQKIAAKFVLGTSFAAVVLGVLIQGGNILYMLKEKTATMMVMYMIVLTVLMAKRGLEFVRTCESCEYKMHWSRCPGFSDLVCDLIEMGFVHPKRPPQHTAQ